MVKKETIECYIPVLFKYCGDVKKEKKYCLIKAKKTIESYFSKSKDSVLSKEKSHNNEVNAEPFKLIFNDQQQKEFQNSIEKCANNEYSISVFPVRIFHYKFRMIVKYQFCIKFKTSKEKIGLDQLTNLREVFISTTQMHLDLLHEKMNYSKCEGFKCALHPIIFYKRNKRQINNAEEYLGTDILSVVEHSSSIFVQDKRHFLRISAPSTIVYSTKEVSQDMKYDILQSVYQYVLYPMLHLPNRSTSCNSTKSKSSSRVQLNVESAFLSELWENLMDNHGGKSIDKQLNRYYRVMRNITLFGITISIVGIIIGQATNIVILFSKIVKLALQ